MPRQPRQKLNLVPVALAYIARYAASTARLRLVLKRKADRRTSTWETPPLPGEVAAAIETAVARLAALGLLNDPEYAAAMARTYRARGESAAMIRARLLAKGIEPGDIAPALGQFEDQEQDAALRFAKRKRLGPYRLRPGKPDQRQRDIASLCRAGFSVRVARTVIDG
jgi:regulatory protein